ncbi:MAG: cell wall hydrolase [Dehalococcoidia bacterium]|jgi:spore germination cell wall hydrolase CwlJ-like protein
MKAFADLPDNEIMALTIYGEARGEPYLGKVAVGSVVLNRVDLKGWQGKTISEVCLKPYQFSCFLKSDPNSMMLLDIAQDCAHEATVNRVFAICMEVSDGLITGTVDRITEGTHYHSTGIKVPNWAYEMKRADKIGRHIFYR